MTRKGHSGALAQIAEVSAALQAHGQLLCQPHIEEEDGEWTLCLTLKPSSVTQGLQVLELAATLKRVQDVAQLRGFAQTYDIDPAQIERLIEAADNPTSAAAASGANVASLQGWKPMTDQILELVRARGPIQKWKARFARRDNVTGSAPEWNDFENPQEVTFRVATRGTPVGRQPKGWIYTIYVESGVNRAGGGRRDEWAEYSEADYGGNGEFLVEEWRMQLIVEELQESSHGPADPA